MKRSAINGIMDEIQRENHRLKSQIISLRKQLNSYENKMIDELSKFDQSKLIFQSPMQCLEAFLKQLAFIIEDYKHKNVDNLQLETKVKNLRKQNQFSEEKLKRTEQNLQDQKGISRELQKKKKQSDDLFSKQIKQLKQTITTLNNNIGQLQLQLQLKQISIEQQKRLAVSAISHQSKRQMLELKQTLQAEYLKQTLKMHQEMKQKDEKIKNLLKGLLKYDKGQNISGQEISQMKQLVESIGNLEELDKVISQLKDQNFQLKKDIKQNINKKTSADLKNLELKNQIKNLLLKQEKIMYENSSLEELVVKTREELATQKNSTKSLQYYFEQKWNNQFQKVKNHLEKVYSDKVVEHAQQLQLKKNEVSRRIDSYVFLHKQDQKIVIDLKKKIETLCEQIKIRMVEIKNEKSTIQQYKRQLSEINKMHRQDRETTLYEWSIKLQQKQDEMNQLKQELNKSSSNQQVFELKTLQLTAILKQNFRKEKQELQRKYSKQKDQILQQKMKQIRNLKNRHEQTIAIMQKQQEHFKTNYQFQIIQSKLKFSRELDAKVKELQEQRKSHKQLMNQAELHQKSLKKQIQDLKQYFMKKIKDLQKQLQNKNLTIQVINVKSQNDQDLKKQLRQMIQQKIYESKQHSKEKQDLKNEIQAKDSEINHLNHQITGLKLTKDDWLQIIIQVRDQFFSDMHGAIEMHRRQIQILKSKIWELENIISKRPIRFKDEKKIRSLSEQKKELQNKIQIKQAQNIVLKQIKHYYQKKNEIKTCTAQMSMTSAQFKKPQSISIMNKRPRRTKINFYESMKRDYEDESQSNTDIQRMRKYLQRCREGNNSVNEDRQIRKDKNTSRNYLNRSLDQ